MVVEAAVGGKADLAYDAEQRRRGQQKRQRARHARDARRVEHDLVGPRPRVEGLENEVAWFEIFGFGFGNDTDASRGYRRVDLVR